MEDLLISIERDRARDENSNRKNSFLVTDDLTHACNDFANALRNLAIQYAESNKVEEEVVLVEETKESKDDSTAAWLYNLSSTIPSPLDTFSLASGILSACKRGDDMSIQSGLFDTLGEGERAMEVLFEIMPRASEISSQVNETQLREIHERATGTSSAATFASSVPEMDPEIERLNLLRQRALEAQEYASLLKVEMEGSFVGGNATHTVKRASDKANEKRLKKAIKDAAKAMELAKEAGAILGDDEFQAYDSSLVAFEAANQHQTNIHQMDEDQFNNFQASLLPEGTREYHEQKGLPAGTEREYFEGYEMVTIPAPKQDPAKLHKRIVLTDVMNATESKAFAGTTSLNPMQSAVFESAFNTNENLLICAPTGAGKTNVAMLTVVAHLRDKGIIKNENDPYAAYQDIGDEQTNSGVGRKIVYIAPMKALAQEVVEKFSSKLKVLGIIVRELTGDMQLSRQEAESADILVTTPEKWDVVTRKGGDGSLAQTCGLLIIDEVHLLADERGAVIESVVARLHRLVESSQKQVRIVGLSATLPNYKDVATFLRVDKNRGLHYFGPEHRPVPLQQQFIGVTETKNRFRKEKMMNQVCYDVVADSLKRGYQVMVFVHSRKGTGGTIEELTEIATKKHELEKYFITKGSEENGSAHSRYADKVEKSRNREVVKHFKNGMGIHHAGMLRGDRKLTEQMFFDGAIKVLCCTATLAWGVNLPAHSVVIKGTDVYNAEKGGSMDLSILDVMQIFGRAGRPQFDNFGEATLITTQDALARYLDKLVKEVPIESTFIKQLADHLNAEVVGGTVTNIREAAEWLMYTYLHVRMTKNPIAYGINQTESESDPMLRGRSLELVKEAAKLLDKYMMLRFDPSSGNLAVTDLGRVASHFYIRAESVARFNEMLSRKLSPTDACLLDIICNATEFENVKVRQEELDELDNILKKDCPLQLQSSVDDFQGKSCVLLQAFISGSRVKSFTLTSDTNYIASNAGRVARALFEMCLKRGAAGAALKLLRIAKSADKRLWWWQTPLRQFEKELPQNIYRALEHRILGSKTEYNSFEYALSLLDMDHSEVGQLAHAFKEGKKIQKFVRYLPNIEIECDVQPVTKSILRFSVTLTPVFSWNPRWHGGAEGFWMWIEDSSNSRIYHQEYVLFSRRTHPDPMHLELTIPAFSSMPSQYFVRVVSDSWVGSESLLPVSFEYITMPEASMRYTNLMDLTPLPVSALSNEKFQQLYTKFATFNPIQTQLFHTLYHTGQPVLLGAPTGSGKTIVAEIALLRMKRDNPKAKCVYIAPLKSLARERLKEWKKKLGASPLNWKVLELSGDTRHDSKSLRDGDVFVCTPEKYDLLSRGWREQGNEKKGRDFVKDVRLLIIDEIHLLGEERGAVLEAIVSRTRFISRLIQAEKSGGRNDKYDATRIIGLSTAISNAHDLASWMGIDTENSGSKGTFGLYNFRPNVRPVPMEVHIQGFAGRHYCPRMATMNKPCYAAIKEHSPTKPVIIFVASRRQTRLTALDLISYAAGDENPGAFLGCSDQYIESVASTLNDESLRHTITYGIGLHHAGLSSKDREVVETLYLNGDIQVLVATATLAWGVNLPAHFVIVKGTEYFDGKESRYVDYPVTDVLQMFGRAGRPQFDTKGVALVMVEESKKNFYKKFLYDPFPVESCLSPRLAATINAEIAIGTITSLEDCLGYMDWTFFARRVKNNPSYYGAMSNSDEDVADFMRETVNACVEQLKKYQCVVESADGLNIHPTNLGHAASKYYLDPETPQQMQKGVKGARELLKKMMNENGKVDNAKSPSPSQSIFPVEVEETVIASLFYSLSRTKEFSELPCRHNEEHLNADLSEDLPWGPDVPGNENKNRDDFDIDIFAEPATKCYILIQAYLSSVKLPISDYINDTKSVLDQLPRLLAAMETIALGNRQSERSFDMLAMFTIARQSIESRSMPGDDPLYQYLSHDKVKYLTKRNITLCDLRTKANDELKSLSIPRKALERIKSETISKADNISVSFSTNKTSGKSTGTVKFDLNIEGGKRNGRRRDDGCTFVITLGTFKNGILLAQENIHFSSKSTKITRNISMNFDWNLANSCGGEDGGYVILRIMPDNLRGFDIQYTLPMK